MRTAGEHPTLHDVARDAGVSVATISNVLNHPDIVAPSTRARVRTAMERVGYVRRSAAGRVLVQSQPNTVALVVPDITNRFYSDLARGAQVAARESGLRLFIADHEHPHTLGVATDHPDQQDDFLDYFAAVRMGGMLLAGMRDPTTQIDRVRGDIQSIVVIDFDAANTSWCSVLTDNERLGLAIAQHVAEIGIGGIFLLSEGDTSHLVAEQRAELRRAAEALGIAVVDVATAGVTVHDGQVVATRLLPMIQGAKRSAIACVTDDLAIGVLSTLRTQTDIRVPEDVAVIGMDGCHIAKPTDAIGLTTITRPAYDMGHAAVQLLQEETDPTHSHRKTLFPIELVPRESTTLS